MADFEKSDASARPRQLGDFTPGQLLQLGGAPSSRTSTRWVWVVAGVVGGLLLLLSSLVKAAEPAVETTSLTISVPTAVPPSDVGEAVSLLAALVKAFSSGDYALGAAIGLMLLVFVLKTYLWKSIPPRWIPALLLLTTAALAVAGGLRTGVDPAQAALNGVIVALAAVGAHQFLGKLFVKK